MAELQTLARPYAKAVFELAHDGKNLPAWSDKLAVLAAAVKAPDIARLLGHPSISKQSLADAITGALGDKLGADGQGFVRLLADNGRLALLPLIAEQFEALRAEAESRVDVQITSATPVPAAQQTSLSSAVGQRLRRAVVIDWKTDESLIAGAVIRAGDLVIDGSVSGELERLKYTLSQ